MELEMVTALVGMVQSIGLDVAVVLGIIGVTWLVKKNVPATRGWVVLIPLGLGVVAALATTTLWADGHFQVAALTRAILAYSGGASISYNVWESMTRPRRRGSGGQT